MRIYGQNLRARDRTTNEDEPLQSNRSGVFPVALPHASDLKGWHFFEAHHLGKAIGGPSPREIDGPLCYAQIRRRRNAAC